MFLSLLIATLLFSLFRNITIVLLFEDLIGMEGWVYAPTKNKLQESKLLSI